MQVNDKYFVEQSLFISIYFKNKKCQCYEFTVKYLRSSARSQNLKKRGFNRELTQLSRSNC